MLRNERANERMLLNGSRGRSLSTRDKCSRSSTLSFENRAPATLSHTTIRTNVAQHSQRCSQFNRITAAFPAAAFHRHVGAAMSPSITFLPAAPLLRHAIVFCKFYMTLRRPSAVMFSKRSHGHVAREIGVSSTRFWRQKVAPLWLASFPKTLSLISFQALHYTTISSPCRSD